MNYNHLRYFSVLAQVEHYTVAAARLGISQPSLSAAIRSLENEIGVVLFEKVGRNVRLTQEGRFFQEKVDAAIGDLGAAVQTLMNSRDQAPIVIRLGFISGSIQGAVAREMAQYLQSERRARLHLTEGSAKDLMDLLRQEKLDMALVDVSVRDRSLHFRKLNQRDFCVAVPVGHPLSGQETLRAADLTIYPQIGFSHSMDRSFENWASNPGERDHFVCQVNSAASALSLVSAGVGVTIIPTNCMVPDPNIRYIPLKNRHQALYMCIVYDRWLEPPVWDFAERLVSAMREEETA